MLWRPVCGAVTFVSFHACMAGGELLCTLNSIICCSMAGNMFCTCAPPHLSALLQSAVCAPLKRSEKAQPAEPDEIEREAGRKSTTEPVDLCLRTARNAVPRDATAAIDMSHHWPMSYMACRVWVCQSEMAHLALSNIPCCRLCRQTVNLFCSNCLCIMVCA